MSKQVTLDDYWEILRVRYLKSKGTFRYGQLAYNLLYELRYDLSQKLIMDENDPYYVTELDSPTLIKFSDFLLENW